MIIMEFFKQFLGYDLGYKIRKPPLNIFRSGFLRRKRDSNPRYIAVQ